MAGGLSRTQLPQEASWQRDWTRDLWSLARAQTSELLKGGVWNQWPPNSTRKRNQVHTWLDLGIKPSRPVSPEA